MSDLLCVAHVLFCFALQIRPVSLVVEIVCCTCASAFKLITAWFIFAFHWSKRCEFLFRVEEGRCFFFGAWLAIFQFLSLVVVEGNVQLFIVLLSELTLEIYWPKTFDPVTHVCPLKAIITIFRFLHFALWSFEGVVHVYWGWFVQLLVIISP